MREKLLNKQQSVSEEGVHRSRSCLETGKTGKQVPDDHWFSDPYCCISFRLLTPLLLVVCNKDVKDMQILIFCVTHSELGVCMYAVCGCVILSDRMTAEVGTDSREEVE